MEQHRLRPRRPVPARRLQGDARHRRAVARALLIVGLSGTGKTTTTFTTQLGSKPAQDDFIALMPGGRVYTTENGCFAKTFGLDPKFEPAIYNATTKPDAYLENVSVDSHGAVDFFDTSYTKNGRTTWPFSYVDPWPADDIPPAEFLLILNRNENIVPGVARLDRAQAAAYFMLGETTGTSAGGKDEEGKFLRVPGTNPFFPRDMADMGNRMLELLDSHEMRVFVLNTGRVGGGDEHEGSKKVTIPYSSAIVQAIVEEKISWTTDPDFGYEIAASLPGVDDPEILQPRRLYERQGRMDEYTAMVARLKRERREYLSSFAGLDEAIVKSIGLPGRSADPPRGPASWPHQDLGTACCPPARGTISGPVPPPGAGMLTILSRGSRGTLAGAVAPGRHDAGTHPAGRGCHARPRSLTRAGQQPAAAGRRLYRTAATGWQQPAVRGQRSGSGGHAARGAWSRGPTRPRDNSAATKKQQTTQQHGCRGGRRLRASRATGQRDGRRDGGAEVRDGGERWRWDFAILSTGCMSGGWKRRSPGTRSRGTSG